MNILITNSILGVALIGVTNGAVCLIAERVSRKWAHRRALDSMERRIQTEKARLAMLRHNMRSSSQGRA